jgi:hypothetical protein
MVVVSTSAKGVLTAFDGVRLTFHSRAVITLVCMKE